ncbi:MAG: hypothetical protein EXS31_06105 [Pedosphaera sp.]|nr:hypothetical protein [Pedosphaera sp.]
MMAFSGQSGSPIGRAYGADTPSDIRAIARPAAGFTQILFHGKKGPYLVQTRATLEADAPWADLPNALVTEVQTGVFQAYFPNGQDDAGFYRVVSESDGTTDLIGWTILVKTSPPANGTHFVPGESPVVTVTILDILSAVTNCAFGTVTLELSSSLQSMGSDHFRSISKSAIYGRAEYNFAQGYDRSSFSTLSLYMHGPQDPKLTTTPVKLLNATADRTKTPHHYIDLKKNADVKVNANVLTYTLKPVTDELPGTYTLSVSATLDSDRIQQIMRQFNVQIGTAQAEAPVVAKTSCAACHEGAISGHMYMYHVDPGRSPTGSWALDFTPVQSCKACHNNDGYAAYSDPAALGGRVPDPIVRRVHGVHMGEGLSSAFNTNEVSGDFKDYTEVVFPADVRNCTKCHVDDRWKTQPSVMACGACHDNTWFGPKNAVPAGMVAHVGGALTDSKTCVICHTADSSGLSPITDRHAIPPPAMNGIDVALTPPANGKFYAAGDKPQVTLVFKNDAGNSIGDHTLVNTTNFSTASLFVYGPRSHTLPVLTSMAKLGAETKRASVTCANNGPWDINGKTIKIGINRTDPQNITIVGAAKLVTAAEVVASLNPVITSLNGGAKAFVSGSKVNIKSLIRGSEARIEIYNGEVTTAMGWKAKGVVLEPDVFVAAVSTPGNDLRPITADPLDFNDPMVTRTAANITYQLDDVAGLAPGTYGVYVYHLPVTNKVAGLTVTGIGHTTFQVGTETPEKKVATNCGDCHNNGDVKTIFHLTAGPIHPAPFDTDYCKACHDYGRSTTGDLFKNQGGTSLSGWSGYGAMPIVRRVHGVHYAHYLDHSEEIYANATKETFGGIIFPQDVRNCTKCHAESDTWKQKPSRMACLACHDSDEAKIHAKIMTYTPDPKDPYGPDAVETCELCHGATSAFSADKVHSITNPYRPPYPREPVQP